MRLGSADRPAIKCGPQSALAALGLFLALPGCVTLPEGVPTSSAEVQQIVDDLRLKVPRIVSGEEYAFLSALQETQQEQARERELIHDASGRLLELLTGNAVNLALEPSSEPGVLRSFGQGVIVERYGPDGGKYRALVTASHVARDVERLLRESGRKIYLLAPEAEDAEAVQGAERLARPGIGVNEYLPPEKWGTLPHFDAALFRSGHQAFVHSPTHDIAATPLSGIKGFRALNEMPGISFDSANELRYGRTLLTPVLTEGRRGGWRGWKPAASEIVDPHFPSEATPSVLLQHLHAPVPDILETNHHGFPGTSGGAAYVLRSGIHKQDILTAKDPAEVLSLAGIWVQANYKAGPALGARFVHGRVVDAFLLEYQDELNAVVAHRK